ASVNELLNMATRRNKSSSSDTTPTDVRLAARRQGCTAASGIDCMASVPITRTRLRPTSSPKPAMPCRDVRHRGSHATPGGSDKIWHTGESWPDALCLSDYAHDAPLDQRTR